MSTVSSSAWPRRNLIASSIPMPIPAISTISPMPLPSVVVISNSFSLQPCGVAWIPCAIARDLGYRGGRRTGLALTDEMHLVDHAELLGASPLARATKGSAVAERTATTIWQVLKTLQRPIFLWNAFPFHPHERNDPMSNRCHTREERQACRHLLMWLLDSLQPRSVIAIGRDAQLALSDLEISARQIRHPSYGGQSDFIDGMYVHYGVSALRPKS